MNYGQLHRSSGERPRLLGVLLDVVVKGLKRLPETHLPKLPRMARFCTVGNRLQDRAFACRHLLGGRADSLRNSRRPSNLRPNLASADASPMRSRN